MFRFTTRDLLWLMAVAGLLFALWIDHRDLVAVRERAVDLRQNLEIARLRFEQQAGANQATTTPPAVNWKLVDEPIP
jgi:hypothetical protein